MKNFVNNALAALILVGVGLLFSAPAYSQAALLPNGQQQFLDSNGNPLSLGKVYMTVPNTGTAKTTWKDSAQTQNNTNPIVLDAGGWATIYGQGNYNQRVTKANGDPIWSKPTTAYGSSVPSGATGTDTAPVGTMLPFSGFTIPTNWALAYGQALVRLDYPDLLTAITISSAGVSCVASSTTLSGFVAASTVNFSAGQKIEASCLPPNTTIQRVLSSTSVQISVAAVATSTVTARVFPWGNGDGTLTFNLPDTSGRGLVGADCTGGTCVNRLQAVTTISTTSASPTATVASATGVARGMAVVSTNVPVGTTVSSVVGTTVTLSANATATAAGTAVTFQAFSGANASAGAGGATTRTPTIAEVPTITPAGTNAVSGTAAPGSSTGSVGAGGITFPNSGTGTPIVSGEASAQVFTGTPFGSGAEHLNTTPAVSVLYMIKTKPNTTGAGGVVSIGGMFGDITCGTNVDCTNNTITFTGTGSGSVSSVGLTMPAMFTVANSPITSFGSLGVTLASQSANLVFAGPASGSSAAPTFRALVNADLTGAGVALTSGTNNWTGQNYFGSGRPWCDPISKGAVGDGSTDDTVAFQTCINQLLAVGQGMMVISQSPSGSAYCIKNGVTVSSGTSNPGGVRIFGLGLPVLSSCGGNVAPIITLSTPYSTIENVEFLGYGFGTDTFGAALFPVISILSPCNGCVVDHAYIFGGTRGIQTDACLAYITRTTIQYQYGSAMLYNFNCGSIVMHNVFDQVAPITIPYGASFASRGNSTVYTAGDIRNNAGWYIQYQTSGTSGAAPPTMHHYGVTITDGTATALLIGPATYYGVQIDTGSQEMQVTENDMTCICTAGIAITNTFAGTAPLLTHLTNNTPGGNISSGVLVSAGSDLHMTGMEVNGCLAPGCPAVYLNTTGGKSIINGLRVLNDVGYGVLLGAGLNSIIANGMFTGAHINSIQVAANVNNFAITGNLFTGGSTGGLVISAGTSNYYTITGNVCNGGGLTDGGTGVNKLVQASCP